MLVMPADSCNRLVYLWQGRYGGLGWILNAYHPRQAPWSEMPWATTSNESTPTDGTASAPMPAPAGARQA